MLRILVLTLFAMGIVGILDLTLGWPITLGMIFSGVSVAAYFLFYLIHLLGHRYGKKFMVFTLVLELALATTAIVITAIFCKYDIRMGFALVAPCLLGARLVGGTIAGIRNSEARY